MKPLPVHPRGPSLKCFKKHIYWSYYGHSWVYFSLVSVLLFSLNAYYPLSLIDLTTVDYFLKERIVERHLSPYLLGSQLIFHGYVLSLFFLFFYDMKRWNWLLPFASKIQILRTLLSVIMISVILMQGVIYGLHQRLDEVIPFQMSADYIFLGVYMMFSYLSVWALFQVKGLVVYFSGISVVLLYPLMNPATMRLIYRFLGLYHATLDLKISMMQLSGMILLGLGLSYYRMTKRALYQT